MSDGPFKPITDGRSDSHTQQKSNVKNLLNEFAKTQHGYCPLSDTKQDVKANRQGVATAKQICRVEFIQCFASWLLQKQNQVKQGKLIASSTADGYLSFAMTIIKDLFGRKCFEEYDQESVESNP
eukprot:g18486.t1